MKPSGLSNGGPQPDLSRICALSQWAAAGLLYNGSQLGIDTAVRAGLSYDSRTAPQADDPNWALKPRAHGGLALKQLVLAADL